MMYLYMKNCCDKLTKRNKTCRRKDGKIFKLPRRFTKKRCMRKTKGFTMKSSCAPYKYCKTKRFHFNPEDPKNSFDVYIDKNPKDTIKIKYTTPAAAEVVATMACIKVHKVIWEMHVCLL